MDSKGVIDTMQDSFLNLVDGAVEYLPKILVALLLLLVGVVLARAISKLVSRIVDYVETSKPVVTTLNKLGVKAIDVDGAVGLFVRWAIILIFLSAAVDVLGLAVLSNTVDAIVGYVPNILAAAVVIGITLIAANAVYDVVSVAAKKAGVAAHSKLAMLAKVIIFVFGLPLAAAQLGLDLTVITNNITVIVAGIMLALGLAFGLGGRDVASKILDNAYRNWKK